jgi:hypothetical protein
MIGEETVRAIHISSDVAIDDFDSSLWFRSPPVRIARYWSGQAAPASRHAEARLLWSNSALHVRFVCPQQESLIVSPTPQTTEKTLGLWDRDVCEIFVAPDPATPNQYFEFEAAPTGEWVDLAIMKNADGRDTDFAFRSGMTAAAALKAEQIFVAMRIPWSDKLPQPKLGDRWGINLFRCVGSDPNRGYVTWRPTYAPEPNFHHPEVFGWLLFVDEAKDQE